MNSLMVQRLKKKLTMVQVAEKANIPFTTYRAIEKGERTADQENSEKIATALDTDVNSLFLPSRFTLRNIIIESEKKHT